MHKEILSEYLGDVSRADLIKLLQGLTNINRNWS